MAGGAVSFKIETLIQLVEGCGARFVSPIALSNFATKELEAYPEKLLVYLKNAFLAEAYPCRSRSSMMLSTSSAVSACATVPKDANIPPRASIAEICEQFLNVNDLLPRITDWLCDICI